MKRIKLTVLLLGIFSSQAQAFDLLDAWQAAHLQDPLYAMARASAEAGKSKSLQAQALNLPQVTANFGIGGVNSDNNITNAQFSAPGLGSANGANFRTRTDAGINASWNIRAEYPLFDAAHTNTSSQLNKQAQLAELQMSTEEQQLMLRVAQAYFDVLLVADTLATLNVQQTAVAEALGSAKERFREGDVAVIDSHEAQARYDLLTAQKMEAESNLKLARAALADISGDQDSTLAELPRKVDLQRFKTAELADWLQKVQNSNYQLHMQQLQQDIAHDESDKYQAVKSPQLNLIAQAGGQHVEGLGTQDATVYGHQLNLGLQLTIPLYTGGMRSARYQESLALEERAKNQVAATRQQVTREARTAWMAVSVGLNQVRAMEQAERSAEIKLDSTRLGREVGDRTTLDELDSEKELFNTRLALYRSRYQVLLAMLNLWATAGELNELKLQEINQLLKH